LQANASADFVTLQKSSYRPVMLRSQVLGPPEFAQFSALARELTVAQCSYRVEVEQRTVSVERNRLDARFHGASHYQ
jgi:hypothetical protein